MSVPMQLQYLDFDFSDEESGRGSFDAMASVVPARLPAPLDEIAAVLRWANETFGAAGALQDEGEWDYELQALAEPATPLQIAYDESAGALSLGPAADASSRITLTLTLSGSPGFCDAFRASFGAES